MHTDCILKYLWAQDPNIWTLCHDNAHIATLISHCLFFLRVFGAIGST